MAELNVVLLVCNEKFDPARSAIPTTAPPVPKSKKTGTHQEAPRRLSGNNWLFAKIENQAEVLYRVGCGKPDTLLELHPSSTHTDSTATGLQPRQGDSLPKGRPV